MSPEPLEHEFLIRGRGGEFYLKNVSSLQAAVFSRPRRIASKFYEITQTQESGTISYRVKNLANGRITGLSGAGYEIWMQMDGKTSLRALVTAQFLKTGTLHLADVRDLIGKLQDAALISVRPLPLVRLHQYLAQRRSPLGRFLIPLLKWTSFHVELPNVDGTMSRFYSGFGKFFFRPVALLFLSILAACGSWFFFKALFMEEFTLIGFVNAPWKWGVGYLSFLLILPVHELAHALAAKHFGYPVRCFGFVLLHRFAPIFYADVTDVWLASPLRRMTVALAGPLSSWILGSLAVLAAAVFPQARPLLFLCAFFCYAGVLFNLYPFFFWESDGYYALADVLRVPDLRKNAWNLFVGTLRRNVPKIQSPEIFLAGAYGVLSAASGVFVVWLILRK